MRNKIAIQKETTVLVRWNPRRWIIALCLVFLSTSTGWPTDAIVLGVPTATGFIAGREALNAASLAVEEINAAGGICVGNRRIPLAIRALDTRDASPGVPVAEALLGIEKLILKERPVALVVGPYRSETLIACMDPIARYGLPMIATIAMTPQLETKIKTHPERYGSIFRTGPSAGDLVNALCGVMALIHETFGFNRVLIMHQEIAWARLTVEAMKTAYFNTAGWEIVDARAYPTGASDFSSALLKARATRAQVILPIFDMPQSGILVKQWNAMHVSALLAGAMAPLAGPAAWKSFDGKIAGAINCNFEMGSAITSARMPRSVAFARAYGQRWGKALQSGHGSAPAYESVYLLAEAITRAGKLDTTAITAELSRTDRKGIMGRIVFDAGHQVVYGTDPSVSAVGVVFQWRPDGGRTIVFPPQLAEGPIEWPTHGHAHGDASGLAAMAAR